MSTPNPLSTRIIAEGLGTALLLSTVVGSGIMGASLSDGNAGLALLANSIATGAMLFVLIVIFGPVSGAQFNPVVTLAAALRGEMHWSIVAPYILSQLAGAVLGVWLAHAMFDQAIFQIGTTVRTGGGQWIAEAVATFGLLLAIFGCTATAPRLVPCAVGLYILSANWFTASTSFANPAVTIARALTGTFAGIAPDDVAPFIAAQLAGSVLAIGTARVLWNLSSKAKGTSAATSGPLDRQ